MASLTSSINFISSNFYFPRSRPEKFLNTKVALLLYLVEALPKSFILVLVTCMIYRHTVANKLKEF